jgi:hypothetical protein
MINIQSKTGTNGKSSYKISREYSSMTTFRGINRVPFYIKQDNMFITELKVNSKIPERKFIISIRRDGKGKNDREYILSQMEFNTNELLQVRDCIDNILNNSIKD